MKVEFTAEEVHGMSESILAALVDLPALSKADRAALRRWRSEQMSAGSPAMRLLAEKVNAELTAIHSSNEPSVIQKPDWV